MKKPTFGGLNELLEAIKLRYSLIEALGINEKNEKELREKINALFLHARLCKDSISSEEELFDLLEIMNACRKKLRSMNNYSLSKLKVCDYKSFDPEYFLEDIFVAADLMLSSFGKSIEFKAEGRIPEISANPEVLFTAVMNLISNAAIHSRGELISASLSMAGNRACLKVENEGILNLNMLRQAYNRGGSGVNCIMNAARLHCGSFLLGVSGNRTKAVLSISSMEAQSTGAYKLPDFTDYICDRLSPMYTALCDCVLCPL